MSDTPIDSGPDPDYVPQQDRILRILSEEIPRYLEGRGGTLPMAEFLSDAIVADGVIPGREYQAQ